MTDLPDLKIKALVTFPANIVGGIGISTTKQNGIVTVDTAWKKFATQSSIPTTPTSNVLTYDTALDRYVMIPSSLLGGAVSGIADAPLDGRQYGRQSGAWTAVEGREDVRSFGAVGNGSVDDILALEAARDYCIANNKSMVFYDGTYRVSRTLNLSHDNLHVLAMGGRVTIKGTGPGIVVAMDAGVDTAVYDGVMFQTFGGPNFFNIVGNAASTIGFYLRSTHHSSIRVNVRDVTSPIQSMFGVCNRYEVICSSNEAPFVIKPTLGASFSREADSEFYLIIEGIGSSEPGFGYGCAFTNSQDCYLTGTVEGCSNGGIYVAAGNVGFTFRGLDCEVNDPAETRLYYDFNVSGAYHTFINCIGAQTLLGSSFNCSYSTFLNCDLAGAKFWNTAVKNVLIGNHLRQAQVTKPSPTPPVMGELFVDDSTTTIRIANDGATDKNFGSAAAAKQVMSGNSGAVQTAATAKFLVSSFMTASEFQVYVPIGVAGTFSNLTIVSDGSPGSGNTYVGTLRKALADTAIVATIPNGLNEATSGVTTVHFNAGERFAIKALHTGTAPASSISYSIVFTPD